MEIRDLLTLWAESKGYEQFWVSYFYMITHPKKCLRMIQFTTKVFAYYGLPKDFLEGK